MHDARAKAKAQVLQATQENLRLAQRACDLNEEHITTITQRTNVLERERHSTKLALESAERYVAVRETELDEFNQRHEWATEFPPL